MALLAIWHDEGRILQTYSKLTQGMLMNLSAAEGLDVLLCHLYDLTPEELFFGMDAFKATKQLVQLMGELGASRTILSNCEAALLAEHYGGSVKTGEQTYGQRFVHGNGSIYFYTYKYEGSGLFTKASILQWAELANVAGLEHLASQCGIYIYFNGDDFKHSITSLPPSVLQGLLSCCNVRPKSGSDGRKLAVERGRSFNPIVMLY